MGTARRCTAIAAVAAGCALSAVFATAAQADEWAIQPSPNPPEATGAELVAVSCTAKNSCFAVGRYGPNGETQRTLAEGWNGSSWTILKTRNPKARYDELSGVSCTGPEACMAVGTRVVTPGTAHALAERWNGRRWTVERVPSPSPGSEDFLRAVSCTASDSCTAVGGLIKRAAEAQEQPFAEHWNGVSWSPEAVPNPEAEEGSGLQGVSCSGPEACTAVGSERSADVLQVIFAMRFNGATWNLESQPNPGEESNHENAVSCPEPSGCVAVGSWQNQGLETEPLAEQWNGSGWTLLASQGAADAIETEFEGVACTSTKACVAVGESSEEEQGLPSSVLAERWDGTTWTIEEAPDPSGTRLNDLSGVACGSNFCTAVGTSWNGTVSHTLVESLSTGP
jgi:hypothetical protein